MGSAPVRSLHPPAPPPPPSSLRRRLPSFWTGNTFLIQRGSSRQEGLKEHEISAPARSVEPLCPCRELERGGFDSTVSPHVSPRHISPLPRRSAASGPAVRARPKAPGMVSESQVRERLGHPPPPRGLPIDPPTDALPLTRPRIHSLTPGVRISHAPPSPRTPYPIRKTGLPFPSVSYPLKGYPSPGTSTLHH